MTDIPAVFSATSDDGVILRFDPTEISVPSGGHMQGIQQLDNEHLVISSSSDKAAYFFIVNWSEGIQSDEVGKAMTVVIINDDFPDMIENHASGIQLCDYVLVVGMENRDNRHKSSVVFYDLSDVNHPQVVGNRINRTDDTAGAVGIVKRANDYLLAVGGWDSDRIDFYVSNSLDLTSSSCVFTQVKTWQKDDRNTTGWIDPNWGKYQSLNLLRDTAGQLYLIGFNKSGKKDWADLYTLNMSAPEPQMLKKIAKKHVYCHDGAHFEYGGGLYAPNPETKISLWATEKRLDDHTTLNFFA